MGVVPAAPTAGVWVDVLTASMIRQVSPHFVVLIRGSHSPVVAKLAVDE